MKLLICAFEQLSDLKINFHKSQIFCFGEATESIARYTELFGCSKGEFPLKLKYLGIPIHFRKLSNADWKQVDEHFEKRLSSWKGKHLSTGRWLTLINSVLSNLPMYMMSFFYNPKRCAPKIGLFSVKIFFFGEVTIIEESSVLLNGL